MFRSTQIYGALAAVLLLLLVPLATMGCSDDDEEENAEMMPGAACLSCHGPGGEADDEVFSVAGTVHADGEGTSGAQGVVVTVTDSQSATVTMHPNGVGNFFSEASLSPPFEVTVTNGNASSTMSGATGDCNGCHAAGGQVGRLVSP